MQPVHHLGGLDWDLYCLAAANHVQRHGLADLFVEYLELKLLRCFHRHAIDADDDVSLFEVAFGGRGFRFDAANHHTVLDRVRQLLVVRQRLDADAEPGADDAAFVHQLIGNLARHVDRNGEADAAIDSTNERVDADNAAFNVAKWAAGIAGVDGGIGLQIILISAAGTRPNRRPALRAHKSDGETVVQLIRRSDGDGPLADFDCVTVAEPRGRQVFAVDLDDGHIGARIAADQLAVEFASVFQPYFEFVCVIHHVVVGENVAVGANDHARALAFLVARLRDGKAVLPEEILERRAPELFHAVFIAVGFQAGGRLVLRRDDYDRLTRLRRDFHKGVFEMVRQIEVAVGQRGIVLGPDGRDGDQSGEKQRFQFHNTGLDLPMLAVFNSDAA